MSVEPRFAPGDKVMFDPRSPLNTTDKPNAVYLDWHDVRVGKVYTVDRSGAYDNIHLVGVDCPIGFHPDRLVRLQEAEGPGEDYIIVVVLPEGDYAPAETPKVMRSERQAIKVAEKMAEKHGMEFAVFRRVA